MKPITVLLAEDHMIVREGLRLLLAADSGITVVGEAETGRQAVQMTKKLRPAVVLMDIAMPQLNGLEATRQILKAVPATRVLILSAYNDDEYLRQVVHLNAAGYLIKQTSADLLSEAIRTIHSGQKFFSPTVAKRLRLLNLDPSNEARVCKKTKAILSSREVEVLQLVAEGKANKQIARELDISIKTVEKHRQHLMSKLGLHDTAGLTRYAIGAGIIESQVQVTIINGSDSDSK
jgi:DNA-binding NarL/FixJ family response regulator